MAQAAVDVLACFIGLTSLGSSCQNHIHIGLGKLVALIFSQAQLQSKLKLLDMLDEAQLAACDLHDGYLREVLEQAAEQGSLLETMRTTEDLTPQTPRKLILGLKTPPSKLPEDVFRILSNVNEGLLIRELLVECPGQDVPPACQNIIDIDCSWKPETDLGDIIKAIAPTHDAAVQQLVDPWRGSKGRRGAVITDIKKTLSRPTTLAGLYAFATSRGVTRARFCRFLVESNLPSCVIRRVMQTLLATGEKVAVDESVVMAPADIVEVLEINIIYDEEDLYIEDAVAHAFCVQYKKLSEYVFLTTDIFLSLCADVANAAARQGRYQTDMKELEEFTDLMLFS